MWICDFLTYKKPIWSAIETTLFYLLLWWQHILNPQIEHKIQIFQKFPVSALL